MDGDEEESPLNNNDSSSLSMTEQQEEPHHQSSITTNIMMNSSASEEDTPTTIAAAAVAATAAEDSLLKNFPFTAPNNELFINNELNSEINNSSQQQPGNPDESPTPHQYFNDKHTQETQSTSQQKSHQQQMESINPQVPKRNKKCSVTKCNDIDNYSNNHNNIKKNVIERDLNAMSVVSLYDNDYNIEMGIDKDLNIKELNNHNKNNNKISLETMEEFELLKHKNDSPDLLLQATNTNEANTFKEICNSCNNNTNNNNIRGKQTPNPFSNRYSLNHSLYFNDGLRTIDFVLVWTPDNNLMDETQRNQKRIVFEENLINEGLALELETVDDDLNFVKIHAPIEVLRRYSEILKLRMPMKESLCKVHKNARIHSYLGGTRLKLPGFDNVRQRTTSIYGQLKGISRRMSKRILVDNKHFPPRSHRFTAIYSRDKEYLFDVNQSCFFTAAIRSRIVQFILDRKRFLLGLDDDYAFGIDRLISDEVYLAAYPLHDGEISIDGSVRNLLYTQWAAVSKWYRYQPLDYIKEYFGVKIGLYFAWLGYYTYMLMLASFVGVACFIYSLLTMDSNIPSNEICSGKLNVIMCPPCDHWCDYWNLSETCLHVRITYLFDNPSTVFFAIFMSFWTTLFLELWKRYSAEITHRWDLTGFDIHEEHPRPQYLARLAHVKKVRIDYVTNTKEPQPPFWRMKLPATVFSFSIVLLLVMMAVAAVLAVVLYRMSVLAALHIYKFKLTTSGAILFTTATAASINLCLIVLFNWIYEYLAIYLTKLELLRTQTEFDDSLTLKIYLLQFVNYYASLFYIAFFKGKFIGYPMKYIRFLELRQEECGIGGCLLELCIQLAIIMIGKQAMNTVLELLLAKFYKWLNGMKLRVGKRKKSSAVRKDGQRWWRDFKLVEWGQRSLFSEYLEMVLQYGFVTIFVAAFPLAPFFALLNNILEMRLDAKKLLTFYRRPVSQRVRDIGVWYRILDCIAKLSVITNGFIIAFTSDFIPRLVYRVLSTDDGTLNGYLNNSLSHFNVSHLEKDTQPKMTKYPNITMCRYQDYREPVIGVDGQEYPRTSMYWYVLTTRLAFVVLFENIVALVMILVRWCIPDMSVELRDQIRREAYITNEIIIKQEAKRARSDSTVSSRRAIDANEKLIKLETLMASPNAKFTGSDLDLIMHGPNDPTAPGHSNKALNSGSLERNVNEMFLNNEITSSTTSLSRIAAINKRKHQQLNSL